MTELDVKLVRSFVAVADTLSFTRAAEQLHVAQPWLSVQIRKLEEQLGFRLFERNRNRLVVPSAQAEALLPAARDYLLAGERMMGSARRIQNHEALTLRMGAPDFTAEMPMRSAIVDTIQTERPGVEMEVYNAWTVELLKRLQDSELDVAFTVGPHVEQWCEALVVARYRFALLVPSGRFPDPPACGIRLADLAGEEVAIFRRTVNAPFHDSIAPFLESAGVKTGMLTEPSLVAIMHNTLRTGIPALIGGYVGTSFLPRGLSVLPIIDPPIHFNLNLVRRLGDRSPAVSALWATATRLMAG